MAVGDAAEDLGLPLVPETGEEGRVRWGAQEINRTRDMVAQTRQMIPQSRTAARTAAGITSGTALPTGGLDGDIYFQVI